VRSEIRFVSSLAKHLAYGVVDWVTLGRGVPREIGGERLRFPPRFSRYYEQEYEPETFAFLRASCRPGDVALDIGAHIGLFTVLMARLVGPSGRVVAFEPTPATRDALKRTVALNRCDDRVEVRDEAVTDRSGEATFFDTDDLASNANSLVATGRHRSGFAVKTVSVDDVLSSRGLSAGCVKIDVEGAELQTLRGAERTLERDRPALALALHPHAIGQGGGSLEAIWRLLARHRLEVRHRGELVDADWFVRQTELFDVQCARGPR
jgi:FkbM family methyltransferase